MIEELLPPGVHASEIHGEDHTAYLLPEELAAVEKAVERRRVQYTQARTCARRAMGALGLPERPVLRGPKREPVWPEGVVGSLTHTEGYCAAAVAGHTAIRSVGIDAEQHDVLPDGVRRMIAVPAEHEWLDRAPANGTHWDRILFSAKESVYKAWFPITGRWLGFQDAELTFDTEGGFTARVLIEPPVVDGFRVDGFTGRWLARDGLVLTAITVPR
ncbi:4'-phosphopantetheinyl transferase EntD [Crossiella equi]|uniref:4'-phosphopantetheinyl transferase EntD n=1 Tax=Crossiella equi TaxID=130796 RepID=A0ABS5AAX9_9PSEU|nr:4'-phosphopantetheinyl transferase superfamily protein [Crossiella equi]MBP2473349.1 4'-phosphopantetheinyl transferase EntD [Crossiella equi]